MQFSAHLFVVVSAICLIAAMYVLVVIMPKARRNVEVIGERRLGRLHALSTALAMAGSLMAGLGWALDSGVLEPLPPAVVGLLSIGLVVLVLVVSWSAGRVWQMLEVIRMKRGSQ